MLVGHCGGVSESDDYGHTPAQHRPRTTCTEKYLVPETLVCLARAQRLALGLGTSVFHAVLRRSPAAMGMVPLARCQHLSVAMGGLPCCHHYAQLPVKNPGGGAKGSVNVPV